MSNFALKIGYRNILRNKRRTIITSLVIGIGLSCVLLAIGFTNGFLSYMVRASTSDFFGSARIRHIDYIDESNESFKFGDINNKLEQLKILSNIKGIAPRIALNAMIATPENNLNVILYGISPVQEDHVSKLKTHLLRGEFLPSSNKIPSILISESLAKKLKVSIDSKVVITTTHVSDNSLVQVLFRVKGIYAFNNKYFDDSHIFVQLKYLQSIIGMKDQVYEFAIQSTTLQSLNILKQNFKSLSAKHHWPSKIQLKTWQEFLPTLKATVDLSRESISYIVVFMALLILLTVANTLYMSLFERIFEFGVIQALGTRKSLVRKTIMAEALFMGVFGATIGLILTFTLGGYLSVYGVNYEGLSYNGVTLREPIYFEIPYFDSIFYFFGTIVFVSLICIYPANKILKIQTSLALRTGV